MITTINRLTQELEAIATAHLQLQSFYYGDIVQTYNSLGKVDHCTLLCDIKNAVINDGYTSCTLELMVLDRVLTLDSEVGNKPQQEVESDTLQIINDLYFIIGYSARWQAFGMIEQGAATRKVVESTPDKVTGWYISINLRLRNQQGICDLPVIDYDYGQVTYPQNCPGVTIIRDGEFLEIVESGGTFSFVSGACTEITLTLPDGSHAFPNTDCGISTQVLQDDIQIQATFDGSGNIIVPSCPPPEVCPFSWAVLNSLNETIIQGIVNNPCVEPGIDIPIPDVAYIDCNGVTQFVPYPNVPDTPIVDARDCACNNVELIINANSPIEFLDLTGCPLQLGVSVLDQKDNPVGGWVDGNYVVEIPECVDAQLEINGTPIAAIAPGATRNQLVQYADTTPVGSLVGSVWTIPNPPVCPYVRPDLVDHITLSANNPFGNTKRLTGLTGGYKVGANYFDAAGVGTTEALAFPFGMVLDWFGYNNNTVPAIERSINTLISGGNFNTIVTPSLAALNAAVYGGYSDWSLIDPLAGFRIGEFAANAQALNFDPFNQTVYTGNMASLWSSQEYIFAPTQQYFVGFFPLAVATAAKTQNRGAKAYRVYTFAELGL